MTTNRCFAMKYSSLLLTMIVLSNYAVAQSKSSKYACTEPNPAQLCSAANTCGSASNPCSVDVKRSANAASSTASIANPKTNALFCVKAGTTVQWKSTGKNVGFVVDLGPISPFIPDGAILGGSDRTVSVVAKKPGMLQVFRRSCISGAIYGMCGDTSAELIVIP